MCQPEEDKLENGGDLNAEEIMPDLHGSSDELQKRRTENVQEEGSNVTLELLKIAVNTQDILNSLSHHFKQAFVTDGSRLSLKKANDSKISVDSFMIPNMPGPVLWEHGEGANERNFGAPLYVDRLDASKDESGHQLPANLERTNFNDGFTSILYKDSEFNLTQDSNTDEEVKTGTDTRRVMENSHQRPRNPGRHRGIRNQKSLCIFSSTDAPTLQASPVLDLINLSTPGHSSDNLAHNQARKDAVSQTTLSSQHLDRELSLLHKAFLDQLAYFSKQLADSCRVFGHSWQTTFLADLAEQFKAACDLVTVIMGSSKRTEPASELNQLEVLRLLAMIVGQIGSSS
ncbi:unnamed protein product [Nesidiocoris tenuis]|uniref:Uncharacterized protein n=1 Tax=Nesidiocoris tenuis TaxID=355587 RepID=A0A6H5HA43_9HEMI|nr:unnamed protein product [Nesidiocoris tenuis]